MIRSKSTGIKHYAVPTLICGCYKLYDSAIALKTADVPMSDLRSRSLIGLDLAKIRGLEIGPLDRPILPSAKGRIYYADHSSTEKIQAKYAADPIVNNERICEIDFDLSQVSLSSCAENGLFDVVAASHVIEHVPDLVGWLKDIQTILVLSQRNRNTRHIRNRRAPGRN